jgi:hypothetical protein
MRLPVALAVLLALLAAGPALAQTGEPPLVLRGSSAPPPEPAPPAVVVLREVVYQPVYYPYTPDYLASLYFYRRPPAGLPAAPASVPNGWPLLGGLAPMRR